VLINPITNAADAMSDIIDRPRTLTISSNYNNGLQVEVAVADAGVGIDPKYRAPRRYGAAQRTAQPIKRKAGETDPARADTFGRLRRGLTGGGVSFIVYALSS
jgi:hypothetical protein